MTGHYYNVSPHYRRVQSESQMTDTPQSSDSDPVTMRYPTVSQNKTTVPPTPQPRKSKLSQGSSNSLTDDSELRNSGTGESSAGSAETVPPTTVKRIASSGSDTPPAVGQSRISGHTPYVPSGKISNISRESSNYLPMNIPKVNPEIDTPASDNQPAHDIQPARNIAPLLPGPSVRPKQVGRVNQWLCARAAGIGRQGGSVVICQIVY